MFGVSLEDQFRVTKLRVPLLLTKSLSYCTHYFTTQIGVGSQAEVWLESNMDLSGVRALVSDCYKGRVPFKSMENQPISIVVGMIKLYLSELPVSVCS